MSDPVISVVVVSFNSESDLEVLLPSLVDPRLEVIVVDNASTDNSRLLAEKSATVVLASETNTGWTNGCNRGADAATAPVLAFVNPDARPSPEQLLMLASLLEVGVGSVSPAFTGEDGQPSSFYFRFPTPWNGLLNFTPVGQRIDLMTKGRARRKRIYGGAPAQAGHIDQPGAACLVVEKGFFDRSGRFDERMWLFFSDAEWCLRTTRLGMRHVVAWSVPVSHPGGSSVKRLAPVVSQSIFQRDYISFARASYSRAGQFLTAVGVAVLGGVVPALIAAARGRLGDARQRLALLPACTRLLRGTL